MICLDTNIVIGAINGRNRIIRAYLGRHLKAGVPITLPAVALYELRYGSARSQRRDLSERILDAFLESGIGIIPFEAEDARHAGEIRAHLEARGTPIGSYDTLIAAQARCRGATLATANRREFERVPDLLVTDWTV